MSDPKIYPAQNWDYVYTYPTIYTRTIYKRMARIGLLRRLLMRMGVIYIDYSNPINTGAIQFDTPPKAGEHVTIRYTINSKD